MQKCNARFTIVPQKNFLVKHESEFNVDNYENLKLIIFKITCVFLLQKNVSELTELNTVNL